MRHALLHVVWTEMCVHNHSIMTKIHTVFFFVSLYHYPFLKSSHSQILVRVTSHRPMPLPRLLIDSSVLSKLRPQWAVISPPLFHRQSRCRQEWLRLSDWGVLLLDVIMIIAVVIYSRHLSCWRHSGLRLFLKGMHPSIYINVFMFTWIIRDPASSTEEVNIRFFYESLQIAFPNNVLVSKLCN